MPLIYGGHPANGAPFTLLPFAQEAISDVIYQEHLTGALYLDKPGDVGQYRLAMDRVVAELGTPDKTAVTLSRIFNPT